MDVEDDMELDLVYPDVSFWSPFPLFACSSSPEDIPVVTQCATTTSDPKGEAPKPVEDEDVELELVYPEVGPL
jgi:hypothetical protein